MNDDDHLFWVVRFSRCILSTSNVLITSLIQFDVTAIIINIQICTVLGFSFNFFHLNIINKFYASSSLAAIYNFFFIQQIWVSGMRFGVSIFTFIFSFFTALLYASAKSTHPLQGMTALFRCSTFCLHYSTVYTFACPFTITTYNYNYSLILIFFTKFILIYLPLREWYWVLINGKL